MFASQIHKQVCRLEAWYIIMRNLTYGFIGLGLIGGSIAKSLKKHYPNCTIVAYNRSPKSRILAYEDKTADVVTDLIDDSFNDCDYIFLCTPVEHNVIYLEELKTIIKDDCIITDVGSVKSNIHEAVTSLCMDKNFIGGHPMAGSEKTGYENASAFLLENAYYAITPTVCSPSIRVNELKEIIQSVGAIPVILNYSTHDYAVAAISHVPHLIAAALVNLVKDNDTSEQIMKLLAAGGFKDITRIASSSPNMWQQICSTNSENISKIIDKYIASLQEIRYDISDNNSKEIYKLFSNSREYRNSFSETSIGPISKIYDLYCDIIDESGAISTVAAVLASKNINIKNIGIIHNREFEDGVLRIEFNDDNSRTDAKELLLKYKYKIYLR